MKKFELTMMCTSCKWKITEALENFGFSNFSIDMDKSVLTFEDDVNSDVIIRVVNGIGYKIEEIDVEEDLTDEEIALLEDAMRNGYDLDDI